MFSYAKWDFNFVCDIPLPWYSLPWLNTKSHGNKPDLIQQVCFNFQWGKCFFCHTLCPIESFCLKVLHHNIQTCSLIPQTRVPSKLDMSNLCSYKWTHDNFSNQMKMNVWKHTKHLLEGKTRIYVSVEFNFLFLRFFTYQIFAVLKIDTSIIAFPCIICHFHHCISINTHTVNIYLCLPIKTERRRVTCLTCFASKYESFNFLLNYQKSVFFSHWYNN